MSSETVPYLVRAVSATLSASQCIQSALSANSGDADAKDIIRDTSLTVATLDRVLCDFVTKFLSEASAARAGSNPTLPELLQVLKSISSAAQHKKLPAGGIVSLLYHLVSALEDTEASLKKLSRSRWDRTSTYAYPLLAIGAYLALRYNTRLTTFLANSNGRIRGIFIFLAGVAVTRLYSAINDRVSAKLKLQKLNSQLLVLLRMWLIAADAFQTANVNRNKSYSVMLAALSDQDFDTRAQPVARQLLAATSLPRLAALWPTKALSLGLLKRALDVVYSMFEPGYYLATSGGIVGTILSVPVTFASLLYYGLQPHAAAERAAAVMFDPDVDYIKFIWRINDSSIARLIMSPLVPNIPCNKEIKLQGVACHMLSNVELSAVVDANDGEQQQRALTASTSQMLPTTLESIAEGSAERDSDNSSSDLQQRVGAAAVATEETALPTHPVRHHVSASSDRLVTAAETAIRAERAMIAAVPTPLVANATLPPTLLYLHGGGFVGSFFATDKVMLAKWVACAKSPVNVVFPHYSLSPEVRYPVALDELLRVYLWIRARSPRVAVAGESAGGNLTAALVLRLIAENLPLPDGVMLCYPALCLNPSPSASRALHLNDPLVPVNLLLKLAESYMPPATMHHTLDSSSVSNSDPRSPGLDASRSTPPQTAASRRSPSSWHFPDVYTNPFIHPLYAPDDMLSRFPTTHIMAGGLDPLLDDAVDFNTRLRRLGVPGDLQVHRSLPHGYLYFPFVPDAHAAIECMKAYCWDVLQVAYKADDAVTAGDSTADTQAHE